MSWAPRRSLAALLRSHRSALQFGSWAVSLPARTVASSGAHEQTISGASSLAPVVSLASSGARTSTRAGTSTTTGSIVVSSSGAVVAIRGGSSGLALSAVTLASVGLRLPLVAGASDPRGSLTIEGFGFVDVPRMGSSFITAGPPLFVPPHGIAASGARVLQHIGAGVLVSKSAATQPARGRHNGQVVVVTRKGSVKIR